MTGTRLSDRKSGGRAQSLSRGGWGPRPAPEPAAGICAMTEINRARLRLDLGDNKISTDGAERLATALETNRVLKELDLYNQHAYHTNTPLPRMIYEQVAVRTDYRITIDFSHQVKLY